MAFKIVLAVSAFVENVLIISALRKVPSLHESSIRHRNFWKWFYSIAFRLPISVRDLFSSQLILTILCLRMAPNAVATWESCHGSYFFFFCGASLSIRYRHVITLRRVRIFIILFWISNVVVAIIINAFWLGWLSNYCWQGLLVCTLTSREVSLEERAVISVSSCWF